MREPSLDVVVYTRQSCPLCDEALELLRRWGLKPKTIDIDVHTEFLKLYDHCVPVVMINGKLRFRGRVNEVLLARLLQRP